MLRQELQWEINKPDPQACYQDVTLNNLNDVTRLEGSGYFCLPTLMKLCGLCRGKVQCVLHKDIPHHCWNLHPSAFNSKEDTAVTTICRNVILKMYIRHKSKMTDTFYKKNARVGRFITFEVFLNQKFK